MKPDDSGNYWDPDAAAEEALLESRVEEQPPVLPEPETISWQASEYLQHSNGIGWYAIFIVVTLALIAGSIIIRQYTFTAVVVLMAVAGIIHVRRPPRVLTYVLDDSGLTIDGKNHPYAEFKSFSVVRDGAFYGILLTPVRRFMLTTLVYFAEDDGERIVDAFGSRMPMADRDLDLLDKFLRKIRF